MVNVDEKSVEKPPKLPRTVSGRMSLDGEGVGRGGARSRIAAIRNQTGRLVV